MPFPLPAAAQVGVQRQTLGVPTFNNFELDATQVTTPDPTPTAFYHGATGATSTMGISDPQRSVSGPMYCSRFKATGTSVTAEGTGNTLTTSAAHGLSAGNVVRFGGTPPTEISTGTDYYVIASGLTSTVFKVSATAGGSAIDFTGAGTSVTVYLPQCIPVKGSVMLCIDVLTPWAGLYFVVTKADVKNLILGHPAIIDVDLMYFPAMQSALAAAANLDSVS